MEVNRFVYFSSGIIVFIFVNCFFFSYLPMVGPVASIVFYYPVLTLLFLFVALKRRIYCLNVFMVLSVFSGVFTIHFMGSDIKMVDTFCLIILAVSGPCFVKSAFGKYIRELFPFFMLIVVFILYSFINYLRYEDLSLFFINSVEKISEMKIVFGQYKRIGWLLINLVPVALMLAYIDEKEKLIRLIKFYLLVNVVVMFWNIISVAGYYVYSKNTMAMWKFGENFFRLRGGHSEPSYYGYHLLIISPFYYFLYFERFYLVTKSFHLFSIYLLSFSTIFTFSSGTWFFYPFVLLTILFFSPYRKLVKSGNLKIGLFFTGVVSIGLFFMLMDYYEITIGKLFSPIVSAGSRFFLMKRSLFVFTCYPFLGGGAIMEGSNVYLELLSMYGLIGFVFFGFVYYHLINYAVRNNSGKDFNINAAMVMSLFILLAQQMINNNFFRIDYFIIFGFVLCWGRLKRRGVSCESM